MAVLRTENLQKIYGHRLVVKGIDIAVNTGEIIALLGRNGAGKTTTFQMMVGLIKPDSGTIYLDGTDISRHTSNQRADKGITYLPQENSVFLKTTVEKNLTMILELKKYNKDEVETTADQLLEELGLQSLRKQPAFSLSGGERRRLEICRALVLDPKFLLLDEPFTGIDPLTIVEIQRILLRLKKKGIGIILSDHNVRDALKITDNGYVMYHGKILIEGNPQQIAANAMAKERFLGENFKLGDEIVDYDSSEKR
ncbi:MAG: LPS export ABC transporter ATP-binding protein [Candidatus Aminicenantes bacterium]|nr:LPS export ABC transporter ATP-binding protein [Candidatus Aminicenantes bacterium]